MLFRSAFSRVSVSLSFHIMLLPLVLFLAAITAVVHAWVVVNRAESINRLMSRRCFVFIDVVQLGVMLGVMVLCL